MVDQCYIKISGSEQLLNCPASFEAQTIHIEGSKLDFGWRKSFVSRMKSFLLELLSHVLDFSLLVLHRRVGDLIKNFVGLELTPCIVT